MELLSLLEPGFLCRRSWTISKAASRLTRFLRDFPRSSGNRSSPFSKRQRTEWCHRPREGAPRRMRRPAPRARDHRPRGHHDSRGRWAGLKNGELLSIAQDSFDVFVTTDRNLVFQQNIPQFAIGIIVLRARSNRLADLRLLVPRLLEVLDTVARGTSAGLKTDRLSETGGVRIGLFPPRFT